MTPNPAYAVLDKLVNKEWHTRPMTLKTDNNGQVMFRGFLGEYQMLSGTSTNSFTLICNGQTNIVLHIDNN